MKLVLATLFACSLASAQPACTSPIVSVPCSITTPGTYTTASNLAGVNGVFINEPGGSVVLDCGWKSITGTNGGDALELLWYSASAVVTVKNCILTGGFNHTAIDGLNVPGLMFKGNTVTGQANFNGATGATVGQDLATLLPGDSNTFQNGEVVFSNADNVTFVGNHLLFDTARGYYYGLATFGVNGIAVKNNTCNGNTTGIGSSMLDDCYIYWDSANIVQTGNQGAHVYDCVYEWFGNAANVTSSGNTADDGGQAGFCSYWFTSWQNVSFLGETVTNSPRTWTVYRINNASWANSYPPGLRPCSEMWQGTSGHLWPCTEPAVHFEGVNIAWTSFNYPGPDGIPMYIQMTPPPSGIPPSAYHVGGSGTCAAILNGAASTPFSCANTISYNWLADTYSPYMVPVIGFVDGGYNVCRHTNPGHGSVDSPGVPPGGNPLICY